MFDLRDKETLYATKEGGEASSSSRPWSSVMKNPRIVRVSRTFGGKDRHSKVTTIKGLRDRRIRLSVSTAVQLYDLQDRLGLSQPSKVIDWLLDITKLDIDKLPPLPPIPGHFTPFQQAIHAPQGYEMPLFSSNYPFNDANIFPSSRREGAIDFNSLSVGVNDDTSIEAKLKYWDSKRRLINDDDDDDDDGQGAIGGDRAATGNCQVLAQNLFPIASSSNNASIVPSNHPMYNYYHYWEPSSSLSFGVSSQDGPHHHHHQSNSSNSSSIPSPLALSTSSQLYPSPSTETSLLFPQHTSFNHLQVENNEIRQLNRFNSSSSNNNTYPSSMYTSTGLGLKPFPLSTTHHSHLRQDKDNDDNPWKESSRN
ncbi:hypothetical protein vseg_003014 [Gypsophila vaccaria]